MSEARRILKLAGLFIVWVPLIHPFHGDDFYRHSPPGLRHLLRYFDIRLFDSPKRFLAILGALVTDLLRHRKLNLPRFYGGFAAALTGSLRLAMDKLPAPPQGIDW